MIWVLAKEQIHVTSPTDFPFADQLRFATAFLFFVAFVVTAYVAWDSYQDKRDVYARERREGIRLSALLVWREEALRTVVAAMLLAVSVIRLFVPGPAPGLSIVISWLMALIAVTMTVNSVMVESYRRKVLRVSDADGESELREGMQALSTGLEQLHQDNVGTAVELERADDEDVRHVRPHEDTE